MRLIILGLAGALAAGCAITPVPASDRSQSELDRDAREGCDSSPNTDEMLECRRRTQDSWRNARTRTHAPAPYAGPAQ